MSKGSTLAQKEIQSFRKWYRRPSINRITQQKRIHQRTVAVNPNYPKRPF